MARRSRSVPVVAAAVMIAACSSSDPDAIELDEFVPTPSAASSTVPEPTDPVAPSTEPRPSTTPAEATDTGAVAPTTAPVAATVAPTTGAPADAEPGERVLRVDDSGRVLIGGAGRPFLVLGDAAWSLIVQLEREEVDRYLANRRELGFNAVLVELIEHRFSSDPPRNRYGEDPFSSPGDFTSPNEAYFEHADWVLDRLAEEGFVVFLTPAYTGWIGGTDGWWEEMVAAGTDDLREYGRFLGARYADRDHIVWVAGGDGNPPQPELVVAIVEGIRETDPDALHTAHLAPDTPPRDFFAGSQWLDIDNVYTYEPVYESARAAYEATDLPYFLMESTYENEHGVQTRQLRTQVFHALLTGATGHIFGNNPIWHFDGGGLFDAPVSWHEALDGPGSQSMGAIARLMQTVDWWVLEPDIDGRFLVDGVGSEQDRSVAAVARDGSWAMAYVPTERAVTIDLAQLSGSAARLVWFDASTGEPAWEATTAETGPTRVETPGQNAAGDGDWVLVVTSA